MKPVLNATARLGMCLAAVLAAGVASAQEPVLEEITVTAQKRAQSVQDVGISIVAIGGDDIEANRLFDASGVTELVPNMELGLSPDNEIPIFVIRGVGLQDYNTNNTPTTALVVDDVYQPYGIYGAFSLFDAERIEVLKGPQGGLYGRNSTGGAINIVSKKPSFDATEANVAVDAGNYGMASLRAGISMPFSESFAARLAAQYDSSDGYYYNTHLNRDQGGKDKLQSRLTLSFAPSDAFSADLRVTHGRNKSEVSIPELAGLLDPNTLWEGPLKALGSPDMNVPFEVIQVINEDGELEDVVIPVYCDAVLQTGIPDASCINPNGFTPDGDPYAGADAEVRKNDDDFNAFALNMQLDFEAATLVSVTSLQSMKFVHTNGIGSVGIAGYQNPDGWLAFGQAMGRAHGGATDPNYVSIYDSDIDSWSQELRLLSSGDGAMSWMVGAVYAEDELRENRYCEFPANLYFDYAVFPGCGTMIYDQNTDALSLYGQVAFDLSDTLRLTVDGRYTREKKDYLGGVWINDGAWTCGAFGLDPSAPDPSDPNPTGWNDPDVGCAAVVGWDPETNLFPLAVGAQADYDKKEPSFKVNLDYAPTDDVLVYLSAGQTFKSGGFFGGFFFSPDAIVAYEPETNFAIELGVKSTLADGAMRLNAAVFRYDYKDFQGNLNAISGDAGGGAVFSGLTNLGDVETLGFEADLQWLATDNLTLGLGIGLLDTEVTAVADAGFTDPNVIVGVTNILSEVVPIIGNQLNDAPEFSGNALVRYDFDLGGTLGGRFQVDASWTDDYFLSVSNEPYAREKGVTLVNARADVLGGSDAEWVVSLWGRNLSDESYRTSTNADGIFGNYSNWSEPRTYGVTFSYNF